MDRSGAQGLQLTFVVPVFDEVDGIEILWDALRSAAERLTTSSVLDRWDVVFVDDGSRDGSTEMLDRLVAADPRAEVVHHPTNLGLGGALRAGLAAARGDVVLYTDADLPFDLDRLDDLVGPVLDGAADLVCGRRIGRAREGRWRAVQSLTYNMLVWVVFRLDISDVNFACKVANRRALPDRLLSDSGFVDVEWLVRARHQGCAMRQMAVEFEPRRWGRSTLGGVRTVPKVLVDLVRVARSARPGRPARRLGVA